VAWCRRELACGGFVQEVVRLVSALGLSKESAPADGGESGCAGAGGVEKGGLLAALQAEGLRRGEEGCLQMRCGWGSWDRYGGYGGGGERSRDGVWN
jgi:hypothetical protein